MGLAYVHTFLGWVGQGVHVGSKLWDGHLRCSGSNSNFFGKKEPHPARVVDEVGSSSSRPGRMRWYGGGGQAFTGDLAELLAVISWGSVS